jgi:hypothetical protein
MEGYIWRKIFGQVEAGVSRLWEPERFCIPVIHMQV